MPDSFPYIGLRPFSEDDSLYFKGRDEQIHQLAALLEANRFLMVTGASGDGKSSLVYAGLVPYARAGFFRAEFANWVVADFRPEKKPLHNLSHALSKNLQLGDDQSVEVELRRGFSSLAELYTTSPLYVDQQSAEWQSLPADEKDSSLRKAANLLLVTDQFEEFFTNPENYYRNAPSAEAQLVINLLLETTRIAIEKNLPIYVVCTMRSDYIGQCSAFRGLPEFIGFSQFFVPRLKRKDVVQVVKDPAFLHGDRITDRLVERVVYDLGEGIDQLPVLEHAMNEVWIQAGNGQEELDLIHYAMAGGMSADELPQADKERFQKWFDQLPANTRDAYHAPGLSQIIDTHANKLYLSAADYLFENSGVRISGEDAKHIIKTAFTCLTKMDEGRAVRNRMTLGEITAIIARPSLTTEIVGGILNIFREPGNTFLRPYITEDRASLQLTSDTVLDITHESLIRNWDLLNQWANEEYNHLIVYEDFKKQLDRWLANNKSGNYLLSIGPLTYFESWYEKLQPTTAWIERYLDPGMPQTARRREATQILDAVREFLRRSATNHRVTRLFVRYGGSRMVAALALIVAVAVGIAYFLDARSKDNEQVLKAVHQEAKQLIGNPRVVYSNQAIYLLLAEHTKPGSFKQLIRKLPRVQQVSLLREAYTEIAWTANDARLPFRKEILLYWDSLLREGPSADFSTLDRLQGTNSLMNSRAHYIYFFPKEAGTNFLDGGLANLHDQVLDLLVRKPDEKLPDPRKIDDALEHLLNFNALSEEETTSIINNFSPFENPQSLQRFRINFPLTARVNYARGNVFAHIAGYQQLAYLYARLGRVDRVNSCIDSLIRYNPNYLGHVDGASQIAGYFLKYSSVENLQSFINSYCQKMNFPPLRFYERWLNASGIYTMDLSNKLWIGENHNYLLEMMGESEVTRMFDLYEKLILRSYTNSDELNYHLSLYYKHRGLLLYKMTADQRATLSRQEAYSLFTKAVESYQKISPAFLNEQTLIYDQGPRQKTVSRKSVFLYPDHFQRLFSRSFLTPSYYSAIYFEFLSANNLIQELYKTGEDRDLIYKWLKKYLFTNGTYDTTQEEKNYTPITARELMLIDSTFSGFPQDENVEEMANLTKLLLLREQLKDKQFSAADKTIAGLKINRFASALSDPDYTGALAGGVGIVSTFSVLINELSEYLVSQNRAEEAMQVIHQRTNLNDRIKAFADVARGPGRFGFPPTTASDQFIDSAVHLIAQINYEFVSTDPRNQLAYNLSALGGQKNLAQSQSYVRQLSLDFQNDIIQRWIQGIAQSGNYYEAYHSIPDISILTNRLYLLCEILIDDASRHPADPNWKIYLDKRKETFYQEDYGFEQETN